MADLETRHFYPGCVVLGHFQDDQWYLASVEHDNGDGTYTIAWYDGDTENRLKRRDELKLMRFNKELECYQEDVLAESHEEECRPHNQENEQCCRHEAENGCEESSQRQDISTQDHIGSEQRENSPRLHHEGEIQPEAITEEPRMAAPDDARALRLEASIEDRTAALEIATEVTPQLVTKDGDNGIAGHSVNGKNIVVVHKTAIDEETNTIAEDVNISAPKLETSDENRISEYGTATEVSLHFITKDGNKGAACHEVNGKNGIVAHKIVTEELPDTVAEDGNSIAPKLETGDESGINEHRIATEVSPHIIAKDGDKGTACHEVNGKNGIAAHKIVIEEPSDIVADGDSSAPRLEASDKDGIAAHRTATEAPLDINTKDGDKVIASHEANVVDGAVGTEEQPSTVAEDADTDATKHEVNGEATCITKEKEDEEKGTTKNEDSAKIEGVWEETDTKPAVTPDTSTNCNGANSIVETAPLEPYQSVTVYRTLPGDSPLNVVDVLTLHNEGVGNERAPSVFVCPDCVVSKPWLGFGGAFTEASAVTMQKLSKEKQDALLKGYFDKDTGLGYNLGRVHIGSCDFSTGNWTCGDLKTDDEGLTGFSIDRYCKTILPMIHRATDIAGEPLTLMATPWTPVPWMKTETKYNSGTLKPRWHSTWAQHYVRFIQEFGRAGIPIWCISVQNEPGSSQRWESCCWTPEEERDFVRDHLGPALEKAGLGSVKILVGDHNRDGMLERAAIIYGDEQAAKYIWGYAYHWYGDARFEVWPDLNTMPFMIPKLDHSSVREARAQVCFDNVRHLAQFRPDKHIIFTESCQELGNNDLSAYFDDWKLGERYAMNIINDMNSGCEGWIDWNLCLDLKGGPNHAGNFCVSPCIVDRGASEIYTQPCYWYLAHFAHFIRPGAQRVVCSSSRDALEVTAFINPKATPSAAAGSVAVVVLNQSEQDIDFWLKVVSVGAVHILAPTRSILTLVVERGDPSKHEARMAREKAAKKEAEAKKKEEEETATQNPGRRWIVTGGGSTGGIVVRKDESTRSELYKDRLATGARIEEVSITGKRLQFKRLCGEGPDFGWVSMEYLGTKLVEPEDSGTPPCAF